MSGSVYVPPHLRNQNKTETPQTTPSNHEEARSTKFSNTTSRPPPNRQMNKSRSVPGRLNEMSDQEIESLFASKEENPDFQVYENSQVKIHSSIKIEAIKGFPRSGVKNILLENIANLGFRAPTAVQKYSIPYVLQGHDLIVTSQTGSGKTAAFMLPVVTQVLQKGYSRNPTVICLAPTRELAIQIQKETDKFCKGTELQSVCVFGGDPIQNQIQQLRNNSYQIVIATPGRLIDLAKRQYIFMRDVQFLILDEADRMLDMGFEPQISEVIKEFDMPSAENRQTLLFSATFPREVQELARQFMKQTSSRIEVGLQDAPSLIEQRFLYVPDHSKLQALLEVIDQVSGPTLIFVERRATVDEIEEFLFDENRKVVAIHGDREMKDRLAALRGFSTGRAEIMVATDVAARGLDIQNVAHVINLDLPTDLDSYIHRIGRTGRAGNRGIATAFFNESSEPFLSNFIRHVQKSSQELPEGLQEYAQSSRNRQHRGGRGGRGSMSRDRSYHNFNSRY